MTKERVCNSHTILTGQRQANRKNGLIADHEQTRRAPLSDVRTCSPKRNEQVRDPRPDQSEILTLFLHQDEGAEIGYLVTTTSSICNNKDEGNGCSANYRMLRIINALLLSFFIRDAGTRHGRPVKTRLRTRSSSSSPLLDS